MDDDFSAPSWTGNTVESGSSLPIDSTFGEERQRRAGSSAVTAAFTDHSIDYLFEGEPDFSGQPPELYSENDSGGILGRIPDTTTDQRDKRQRSLCTLQSLPYQPVISRIKSPSPNGRKPALFQTPEREFQESEESVAKQNAFQHRTGKPNQHDEDFEQNRNKPAPHGRRTSQQLQLRPIDTSGQELSNEEYHAHFQRDTTLAESEVERTDFEVHKAVEKENSKYLIQALNNAEPKVSELSKQEQFRLAQRVQLIQDAGPAVNVGAVDSLCREYTGNELQDPVSSDSEEDTSPCEKPISLDRRRKSSVWDFDIRPLGHSTRLSGPMSLDRASTGSTRSSLLHTKPYLIDITPEDAQSHHPSIIARSPLREASRTSSLSGETWSRSQRDTPEFQPLTKEAVATKDKEITLHPALPVFPLHRQLNLFCEPEGPASTASKGRSSPLRRSLDSIDMASTNALAGSPAPTPSQAVSRPDTPRPPIGMSFVQDSIEQSSIAHFSSHSGLPWLDRSACPSPVSVRDRNVTAATRSISITSTQDPMDSGVPTQALSVNTRETWMPLDPSPELQLSYDDFSDIAVSTRLDAFRHQSEANFRPSAALSYGQNIDEPVPRLRRSHPEPFGVAQPCLAEAWEEPPRAVDRLSRHPSTSGTPSPPKQILSWQQNKLDDLQNPLSDPFAAGDDLISFPPPADSPPLLPVTSIAGKIYQAKRGQRKATMPSRRPKTTATGARTVSARIPGRPRDASSPSNGSGRRTKSMNLGVQGGDVKVSKAKVAGTRSTSRAGRSKAAKANVIETEEVPEVPSLPVDMDIGTTERRPDVKPASTTEALKILEREQRYADFAATPATTPQKILIKQETHQGKRKGANWGSKTHSRLPPPKKPDVSEEMDVDTPEREDQFSTDVARPPKNQPSPSSKSHFRRETTLTRKKEKPGQAVRVTTPSRTPRRRKGANDKLTLESAGQDQTMPTRRSPRFTSPRP